MTQIQVQIQICIPGRSGTAASFFSPFPAVRAAAAVRPFYRTSPPLPQHCRPVSPPPRLIPLSPMSLIFPSPSPPLTTTAASCSPPLSTSPPCSAISFSAPLLAAPVLRRLQMHSTACRGRRLGRHHLVNSRGPPAIASIHSLLATDRHLLAATVPDPPPKLPLSASPSPDLLLSLQPSSSAAFLLGFSFFSRDGCAIVHSRSATDVASPIFSALPHALAPNSSSSGGSPLPSISLSLSSFVTFRPRAHTHNTATATVALSLLLCPSLPSAQAQ